MNKQLITICAEDEPLSRRRLERLINNRPELNLVASCSDAQSTYQAVTVHQPDLLVLDINMPGVSGMELAAVLKDQVRQPPQIIFITAHAEFAVKAFELQAIDYILKPYAKQRFDHAIDKALQQSVLPHHATEGVDRLVWKHHGRVKYIPYDQLESVTVNGKQVVISLKGQKLTMNDTLGRLLKLLPSPPFFRVSRQAVVNLDYVIQLEELFNDTAEITMISGAVIKASRRGRRHLRRLFENPKV